MKLSLVLCLVLWKARHSSCGDGVYNPANVEYGPQDFEHSTGLDPNGVFHIYWKVDFEKNLIRFLLRGKTQGWLGFGLSPKGGMAGADMITAWIDDEGRGHLQDRHGIGNEFPPEDAQPDWLLLWGRRNETHTEVVVERPLRTCDGQEEDIDITNSTKRLIYAWGESSPRSPDGADLSYHGPVQRGVRFAMLLKPSLKPTREMLTPDMKSWVVGGSRVLKNSSDTLYWCTVARPPSQEDVDTHYVGFRIELGENALEHLHHVALYQCPEDDGSYPSSSSSSSSSSSHPMEEYLGVEGHQCYEANMPPDFVMCNNHYIVWAVGGEGEILPEHLGLPFHKRGESSYFLVEAHYDNQVLKHDLRVSWKMHVYYTEKLRPNPMDILMLGNTLQYSMAIPPGQQSWMQVGHCPTECLRKSLPEEGIRIHSSFLHGHLIARGIRLRHFRNGTELPPIAEDNHYDFNYQTAFPLQEERIVLPGDHLTVECLFDSTGRSRTTFAGLGSTDEMCFVLVYYYPATAMVECTSASHPEVVKEVFGIDQLQDESQLYITTPDLEPFNLLLPTKNSSYQEWLQALDWKKGNSLSLDQKSQLSRGTHLARCTAKGGKVIQAKKPETSYPNFLKYTPPAKDCGSSHVRAQARPVGNRGPSLFANSLLGYAGCLLFFFRSVWV